MKVLFSNPYSGALHQWFSERGVEFDPNVRPMTAGITPGYYRHALSGARSVRDIAIASLVLFDDVLLAAGDFPVPSSTNPWAKAPPTQSQRTTPGLGIETVWNCMHDASIHVGDIVDDLASTAELKPLLAGLDKGEYWFEVCGAVADAMLVGHHQVPLICGRRRRKVIGALIRLGVITPDLVLGSNFFQSNHRFDPLDAGADAVATMYNYRRLSVLRLREPTIRSVAEVKHDRLVRESAESFQNMMIGPQSVSTYNDLKEQVSRASRSRRLTGKLAGTIELLSKALGWAALHPGLSLGLGPIAASGDMLSSVPRARLSQQSWIEFGPRLQGRHASLQIGHAVNRKP